MTIQKERISSCLLVAAMILTSLGGWAELVPGSMDVHWNEGAPNCVSSPQPPLQVHQYNAQTFILRENLCATFEAPFMYLLIGSKRAVLIDTGDVADPNQMPLAKTVMDLLPGDATTKLPLLVVHTHRHSDHRGGDGQFAHLANVEVVGFDVDSVRRYYKFTDWPEGIAQIDLGDRTVDVLPTPGHNETEVSFYDRNTGLFFSGDFLLPGRLMIDDTPAEIASAERVAAFVKGRPISFVLGGHIEKDTDGNTFPWESQYHPHEAALQMTKDDLLALPGVVRSFNGFYNTNGKFITMNAIRLLIAEAILATAILAGIVWALVRYIRRRRARKLRNQVQA
jgi:hydroxyacylglutathione hydrolase